jgi:hypothetical protein
LEFKRKEKDASPKQFDVQRLCHPLLAHEGVLDSQEGNYYLDLRAAESYCIILLYRQPPLS